MRLTVFRMTRDNAEVVGWGVEYPSGWVVLDWNQYAFAPDNRLADPHLSLYGSLDDVGLATSAEFDEIYSREVRR